MADPVERMVQPTVDENRRRPNNVPAHIFPEFFLIPLVIKSRSDFIYNTQQNTNQAQRLALIDFINAHTAHADDSEGGKYGRRYPFPLTVWLKYLGAPLEEIHYQHKNYTNWLTVMVEVIVSFGYSEGVKVNPIRQQASCDHNPQQYLPPFFIHYRNGMVLIVQILGILGDGSIRLK
jgi:hypothetical protein